FFCHAALSLFLPLPLPRLLATAGPVLDDDVYTAQQKAIAAALARVSPTMVQIETSGGTDIVSAGRGASQVRHGMGPTTGVIVDPDGYVISSAFNFANKPSAIFVAVPGHKERYVAKVVATDRSRMLTLLKINAKGLPIPSRMPKEEIKVG